MEEMALELVRWYTYSHLDKPEGEAVFDVYTVWKCKALQNWKFLISTTLPDGMYYEATYNGDKDEWYLDAYKKFENRCIPHGVTMQAIKDSYTKLNDGIRYAALEDFIAAVNEF